MERGMRVQVVMTRAAQEFITPLTFAALTGNKVITGLFSLRRVPRPRCPARWSISRVAQENEMLVVAPATADLLAKFAHGLADDFLTTMYLAFTGKVVLAPAMNTNMWRHPATEANLEILRKRGHRDRRARRKACWPAGPSGRDGWPIRSTSPISRLPCSESDARDLEGETVLITAGPTQEPLDPVRFISNRSSGKMGYALAEAAAARGAEVILVSGSGASGASAGSGGDSRAHRHRDARRGHASICRKRPSSESRRCGRLSRLAKFPNAKIKKTATRMSLELDPTPDILAELGRKKGDRLLIGFAAETENLVEEARRKLVSKNCDMVVANLVGQRRHRLRIGRKRSDPGAAHGRDHSPAARPETRNRREDFRSGSQTAPGISTPLNDPRRPSPAAGVLPGSWNQDVLRTHAAAEPALRRELQSPPRREASHRCSSPSPARAPSDTLLKILEDIGDCKRCRLHEGRNKIVFGSGNEQARLVFVGEGPGADEDAQGLPFVGRAGQLLTQMIEGTAKKEGIPHRAARCLHLQCGEMPAAGEPHARSPTKWRSAAQFLFRQLQRSSRKRFARWARRRRRRFSAPRTASRGCAGKWHKWHDIPVMVTYHPSYLLRPYNQNAKREAWEDLKKVLHYVYD